MTRSNDLDPFFYTSRKKGESFFFSSFFISYVTMRYFEIKRGQSVHFLFYMNQFTLLTVIREGLNFFLKSSELGWVEKSDEKVKIFTN